MTEDETPQGGWSTFPAATGLRATHLRRVIPIAQSCPVPGGELTLASIELYDDGCILRCHLIPDKDAPPTFEPGHGEGYRVSTAEVISTGRDEGVDGVPAPVRWPQDSQLPDDRFRLDLEDDAGARYAGGPRAGGGDNVRWETSYGFVPAIRGGATVLRIAVHGASPGSAPLHTFVVAL